MLRNPAPSGTFPIAEQSAIAFSERIEQQKKDKGTKVHVPLPPYSMHSEDTSKEQQEQAEIAAKYTLETYMEELKKRFVAGSDYDTDKIATGETFVEIVCGGYMQGRSPVRCYEPLTAVQLFIDAVERYFAIVPYGQTLHWRTRPEWAQRHVGEDEAILRTIYSIYARLVLV